MRGIYSNLYYPTRWVPLRRRGLGWQECNRLYEEHRCVASCGLAYNKVLELVVDLKGCNLHCKYCWCWKMRFMSEDVIKDSKEVLRDLECRFRVVEEDRFVSKRGYSVGVIRITGNEPSLQWDHVKEVLRLIDRSERLKDCKVIVETNGVLFGKGLDFRGLEELEVEIDIDVSFKGVNYDQFEWLASVKRENFRYQIEGFVKLFDHYEGSNVNVNPVLGINHAKNYCVWKGGKRYVMDVEIVDREGRKMDFYDYSEDFEREVLSRKELRYDEAPFREYFGINRESARLVVAVVYKGKRFLRVLPSEVPDLA